MVFIVDDDIIMAQCVARMVERAGKKARIFSNGIEAARAFDEETPELIFLDILLDGPDGFTFLNEKISYSDTEKIPVVIISSLDLKGRDFTDYGVVKILDKSEMTPEDIIECINGVLGRENIGDIKTRGKTDV